MYKQIARNKKNTVILMIIFILMITAMGFAVAYLYGDGSIAVFVFVVSVLYAVFQYFFANLTLVWALGASELERKDNPRVYNIVENLTISENLPLPKIYIIDDPAPNALASGRDPKNAIVAVTTGLLDIMDDRELRAVLAHELSHIKNYDIRLSMIVFGLVALIGVLSDLGIRMLRRSDKDDIKSPVGLILALAVLFFMPLVAVLTKFAVSRQREYLADISAAKIIGAPEDMIAALQKLQTHGRPMYRQNSAAASMFINETSEGFFFKAFSTHPSLESRIQKLEESKNVF